MIGHEYEAGNPADPEVEHIDSSRNRPLPARHRFWGLAGLFGAALGDQFVCNLQFIGIDFEFLVHARFPPGIATRFFPRRSQNRTRSGPMMHPL